jgi:hypothetical protein
MRGLGIRFEPDPCDPACIWRTFSPEALDCWGMFKTVTKQWRDPKTKERHFEIDWGAVALVFRAYGIAEEREGLNMLFFIMSLLERSTTLTTEQILGLEEIPDDG